MARGIIIFGASGSGTTTLGLELAWALGFRHFDLDDYYWRWDTDIPFTAALPREERTEKLMGDLDRCAHFVLSGSLGMWGDPFLHLFDLAVFVTAPASMRVERLHKRELARFGHRILTDGDMYVEHIEFLSWAEQYDTMEPPERCLKLHEQWAAILLCPVLRLNGVAPIEDNIERITERYSPILPSGLAVLLNQYSCEKNRVGCSSAGVYRYCKTDSNLYLKIQRADGEARSEHDLLVWLDGKLPVPKVKYWGEQDGLAYLLMTEAIGQMCCNCPENTLLEPLDNTVRLLMLQAVDITDCPFDNKLDKKLSDALYNINNDLVDMDDFKDNGRFYTPMELYHWLTVNRPPEDVCFTHGDYCLPNIFIDGTKVTGFIDLGRGGLADRWQDIALCVRSLKYNLRDIDQGEKDRYVDLLFRCLGMVPDWDKINYYIWLDELF